MLNKALLCKSKEVGANLKRKPHLLRWSIIYSDNRKGSLELGIAQCSTKPCNANGVRVLL